MCRATSHSDPIPCLQDTEMGLSNPMVMCPCPNTGLSKHGEAVFPHFCPLNQNAACQDKRRRGNAMDHS